MAFIVPSCSKGDASHPKVIVIGFDGMDPRLCQRLMDAGKLPHLDQMRRAGGYRPLGTTIPPQSPVAWASFITGANPGVHGIFDFIHRDPKKQCEPYYSAAKTEANSQNPALHALWCLRTRLQTRASCRRNHVLPRQILRGQSWQPVFHQFARGAKGFSSRMPFHSIEG